MQKKCAADPDIVANMPSHKNKGEFLSKTCRLYVFYHSDVQGPLRAKDKRQQQSVHLIHFLINYAFSDKATKIQGITATKTKFIISTRCGAISFPPMKGMPFVYKPFSQIPFLPGTS